MRLFSSTLLAVSTLLIPVVAQAEDALRKEALAALDKSTRFFREDVVRNGGYQYRYSDDLKMSFGEIRRGAETVVTVQPPGTPSVGMAYLDAYEATGDRVHLDAALAAADCLLRGQLRSGGWGYGVEYDPVLRRTHAYRVEPEALNQGDITVLDDNTTQFALVFLMRIDELLDFGNEKIHESIEYALESLLKAQYANGAWPQRYDSFPDPAQHQPKKASITDEWSRTWPGSQRDYKKHYTFNDNTIADLIETLFIASDAYGDARFRTSALKAADFILLAQLPEPQPAWAQQYDADMHPAWARRFEPPAISGRESQDIMLGLLEVYRRTGETRYLDPIPPAIAYFRRSLLDERTLARFYEMKTNEPLYFSKSYDLTYDDSDLPTHYRFKVDNRLDQIEAEYERLRAADPESLAEKPKGSMEELTELTRQVISGLSDRGDGKAVWLDKADRLGRGMPVKSGQIIQSGTFVRNTRLLCEYLERTSAKRSTPS